MAIIGANGVVYDESGNVIGGVDAVMASTVTPKLFTQIKTIRTKLNHIIDKNMEILILNLKSQSY
jgi:hypothetical protein